MLFMQSCLYTKPETIYMKNTIDAHVLLQFMVSLQDVSFRFYNIMQKNLTSPAITDYLVPIKSELVALQVFRGSQKKKKTYMKRREKRTSLASLAIEISFPQSHTFTWYTWALLSSTFPKRSFLHLNTVRFAKTLHQFHSKALARF